MTLETLRSICLEFPGATEDIKWGADLVFSVGGKMFCAAYMEPPYHMSFKCSPAAFAELVERPGLRPAPYLARAMWVQEEALGEALERAEVESLLRAAYDLVAAKLPRSRRPSASPTKSRAKTRRKRAARPRARASSTKPRPKKRRR
jgi:predicted DNA-binding protein (MmcQ/YjbR family)